MNLWQLWVDAMNDPVAKWVVIIFLLVSLILFAIYVAKWFRDLAVSSNDFTASISDNLSEFEKLFAEGKISSDEYQRLKKAVPKQLAEGLGLPPAKFNSAAQFPVEDQTKLVNPPKSSDSDEGSTDETPDFKPAEDNR
jgi:tape measure domain-containing protein